MKIRVTLTLDVDPETWALVYGCDPDGLRDDVKSYVLDAIQQSAAAEAEAIRSVELR